MKVREGGGRRRWEREAEAEVGEEDGGERGK